MQVPDRWHRSRPVRANDLDRSIVCTMLDNAYAQGELDTAEHDGRIKSAMSAKTQDELVVLVEDLQAELPEFARPKVVPTPQAKNHSLVWVVCGLTAAIAVLVLAGIVVLGTAADDDAPTAPAAPMPEQVVPRQIINSQLVVTHETLLNQFANHFEQETGHRPTSVECPGDLDAEPGNSTTCTIADGDATYTGVATVLGVNGTDIRLNTTINDLPAP